MADFIHKTVCRRIGYVLLIVCMCLRISAVRAEYPDVSVFNNAVELDDSELEAMRGKFVSPGRMTFFGLEMHTRWQTSSGELLLADMRMDMNIPKNNNVQPAVAFESTVKIENSRQVVESPDIPDVLIDASITSNGLINISGVTQSIQIAGNENIVANNAEMDITIISDNDSNFTTMPLDLEPVSKQKTSGSGSVVFAGAREGVLQVFAKIPNQGEIIQRIGGMNNERNILQSVRIIGDGHNIINTMVIRSSFTTSISRSGFSNSLLFNTLRGI